jgi:hypothetical protein
MKKPKNLRFEPVHPKNVLLASVVHGISCLFAIQTCFILTTFMKFFIQNSKWRIIQDGVLVFRIARCVLSIELILDLPFSFLT